MQKKRLRKFKKNKPQNLTKAMKEIKLIWEGKVKKYRGKYQGMKEKKLQERKEKFKGT